MRPLEGVRILDLTWLLAGAGGPRLLAALGAEVIRLEWRDRLDFLRYSPPVIPKEGETAVRTEVQSVNRGGLFNDNNPGKRSFSLNMAHPKGKEVFKRLVTVSDVVVESFRADAMTKWGLGYEVLRSLKPDIIYVQQSGWGHKGPYWKYASYGPIAQAISGLTDQSGLPDPYPPAGWGYSYMDWSGAYYTAIAMLLSIYYKKRTGKGQYIDGSQIEPGDFHDRHRDPRSPGQRPQLAAHRQPLAVQARGAARRLQVRGRRSLDRDRGQHRRGMARAGRGNGQSGVDARCPIRHAGGADHQPGRTRPPG